MDAVKFDGVGVPGGAVFNISGKKIYLFLSYFRSMRVEVCVETCPVTYVYTIGFEFQIR